VIPAERGGRASRRQATAESNGLKGSAEKTRETCRLGQASREVSHCPLVTLWGLFAIPGAGENFPNPARASYRPLKRFLSKSGKLTFDKCCSNRSQPLLLLRRGNRSAAASMSDAEQEDLQEVLADINRENALLEMENNLLAQYMNRVMQVGLFPGWLRTCQAS